MQHMLLARSAITRGMQLVAGMLSTISMQDASHNKNSEEEFRLVTWTSSVHSRREDELARTRQMQIGQ